MSRKMRLERLEHRQPNRWISLWDWIASEGQMAMPPLDQLDPRHRPMAEELLRLAGEPPPQGNPVENELARLMNESSPVQESENV